MLVFEVEEIVIILESGRKSTVLSTPADDYYTLVNGETYHASELAKRDAKVHTREVLLAENKSRRRAIKLRENRVIRKADRQRRHAKKVANRGKGILRKKKQV